MNIKKNDKVRVITGSDKGKEGVVIEILPKKGKIKVSGDVGEAVRHRKARQQSEKSAVKKIQRFIDASNVEKI